MNITEELRKKYQDVKRGHASFDLLSLKSEVESYITNLQVKDEENKDLIAEAQDMLIDLTKIIDESHCHPFRPKRT